MYSTNLSLSKLKSMITVDSSSGYYDLKLLFGDTVYHLDYLCHPNVTASVFRILSLARPRCCRSGLTLKQAYMNIYNYFIYNLLYASN